MKKLLMFTGVSFFLFFLIGIGIQFIKPDLLFIYFLIGFISFAISNFFYYYINLIKEVSKIDNTIEEIMKDRIDMNKDIEIKPIPHLNDFMKDFLKTIREFLSKLIILGGKTSIFNAKFNFELNKAIKNINDNIEQFEAINSTMNDSTKAINDISSNVEQFSNFMNDVEKVSIEATEVIERVVSSIKENIESMKEGTKLIDDLSDNLQNISGIAAVINDIADQTNLLSLNAAIEAARAGEAGRGFSVVADEIRKLAESTQKNASEIATVINNVRKNSKKLVDQNVVISGQVEKSADDAATIQQTFADIKEEINKAANMLSSITAAIEEQSASIEEVSQTVDMVVNSTKETVDNLNKVTNETVDLNEITDLSFSMMKTLKVDTPLEKVYNAILNCKKEIEDTISDSLKSGIISSFDLWDRNYVEIKNTNPQKYETKFTKFFKQYIQPIEDKYLNSNPDLKYFAVSDDNGYVPAHNSIYDEELTGDYNHDLAKSRSKRILTDPVSLKAAKNQDVFVIQTYTRDTGEVVSDMSVPLFIEGRHWGCLRVGLEL